MARKLTKAEATAIKAKWDAEDPLLHYVPPVTLGRANESKSRYICVHAPNQCGKTAWMQSITASVLRNASPNWVNVRPVRILLVIPSRAQAADVWGNRLLKACTLFGAVGKYPWIPERDIKKVTNSHSPAGPYPSKIVMKNGNELIVILSGVPNSWKALEGMTFDMVIRDEVAGTENLGDEIQPRLLASRTRTLGGLQPWGGVMLWSATETKYNEEWLAYKQRCLDGVADHVYFKPEPEEAAAYISMAAREEMRKSMSEKSYRIRGAGSLDAGDLVRIFVNQWDDKRHMLKSDYQVRDDDNIMIGWDPGVHHPTGIVICALTREQPNQLKVVKCFRHTNETTDFDVECIHSFLLGRKIAGFVYDWAAKAAHKHAPSLLHALIASMDAKGYVPMAGYIQADKRVEPGIDSVRSYLNPNSFDLTVAPLLTLNQSQESGCQMLRSEIMGYCKTEPTGTSPGKVVKKNDDLCFAGETAVRMANGTVRQIKDVIVGDMVATPFGPRRVARSWMTSPCAEVKTYITESGKSVTCTPDHPVWVKDIGWRPIDAVGYGDRLLSWTTDQNNLPFTTTELNTTAAGCSVTAGFIKTETASLCIESSTKTLTDQSLRAGTSITWTTIPSITTSPILLPLAQKTTSPSMSGQSHRQPESPLRSGTGQPQEGNGTAIWPLSPSPDGTTTTRASIAASPNLSTGKSESQSFAPITASQHIGESRASTVSAGRVSNAVRHLQPISMPQGKHAEEAVLSSFVSPPSPVYDLEVEEAHCFYAEDILVHNCDPMRYLCRTFPHWAAAHRCGAAKFEVSRPMESAPNAIPKGNIIQTMDDYRAELSRKLANRNRRSVVSEYSWKPRRPTAAC